MCPVLPVSLFGNGKGRKTMADAGVMHSDGTADGRYTVHKEFIGEEEGRFVARFCGGWIGADETRDGAWELARAHRADFCKKLGIEG